MKDIGHKQEDNFYFLLAGLAIFLVTGPILSEMVTGGWMILAELHFSLLMIIGVWSLQSSRSRFRLGIVLLGISLAGTIASLIFDSSLYVWLTIPARLIFLALSAVVILEQILSYGKVSLNKLVGTVCVYLVLAIFWALLCLTLEMLMPGSFAGLEHYDDELWLWRLLYYSFVTLTTLGYGDITPANAYSETLAWLEAVVGQFYIAILVASLVAMYIASNSTTGALKAKGSND